MLIVIVYIVNNPDYHLVAENRWLRDWYTKGIFDIVYESVRFGRVWEAYRQSFVNLSANFQPNSTKLFTNVHEYRCNRYWDILSTDKQTNKQTEVKT